MYVYNEDQLKYYIHVNKLALSINTCVTNTIDNFLKYIVNSGKLESGNEHNDTKVSFNTNFRYNEPTFISFFLKNKFELPDIRTSKSIYGHVLENSIL
jgi:hypothetical protein